jgi:MtN3 and saliva related transmembrane protein
LIALNLDVLGYIAGILTTFAYLPQVIKILRHKGTKDISLGMYVMLCTGIGCWMLYGIGLGSWPIILANAVTLALAGIILTSKIRNG